MPRRPSLEKRLEAHLRELRTCRRCPDVVGPVIAGAPVASRVYLVGQAPGSHEGAQGRLFAWTAGKTLFRWLARIGLPEDEARAKLYFAAVCRCFPGKAGKGGDRVPSTGEIEACASWMEREIEHLQPELIVPIGRLAIGRFLGPQPLEDVVGQRHAATVFGHRVDVIPLPHPSGASTWFKREPGQSLLERALAELARHPAWPVGDVRRAG